MQSPQESFFPYLGIFPPYLLCNLDRRTNARRGSFHTGDSMTRCCVLTRLLSGAGGPETGSMIIAYPFNDEA